MNKLKKRSFGFENNSDLDQNNDEIIANINRDSIISSLNKGRDNSLLQTPNRQEDAIQLIKIQSEQDLSLNEFEVFKQNSSGSGEINKTPYNPAFAKTSKSKVKFEDQSFKKSSEDSQIISQLKQQFDISESSFSQKINGENSPDYPAQVQKNDKPLETKLTQNVVKPDKQFSKRNLTNQFNEVDFKNQLKLGLQKQLAVKMKEQLIEGSRQHIEDDKKITKNYKKNWMNGNIVSEETSQETASQTTKQGSVEFFQNFDIDKMITMKCIVVKCFKMNNRLFLLKQLSKDDLEINNFRKKSPLSPVQTHHETFTPLEPINFLVNEENITEIQLTHEFSQVPQQFFSQNWNPCFGILKIKNYYYTISDLIQDYVPLPFQHKTLKIPQQNESNNKKNFNQQLSLKKTNTSLKIRKVQSAIFSKEQQKQDISENVYNLIRKMDIGNLSEYQQVPPILINALILYIQQVASAFRHLHKHDVVHGYFNLSRVIAQRLPEYQQFQLGPDCEKQIIGNVCLDHIKFVVVNFESWHVDRLIKKFQSQKEEFKKVMEAGGQLKREDYLQIAKILDLQAFGNSILEFMVCKFYDDSDGSRTNTSMDNIINSSQSSQESSISQTKFRRILRESTQREASLLKAKLKFSKQKQFDNLNISKADTNLILQPIENLLKNQHLITKNISLDSLSLTWSKYKQVGKLFKIIHSCFGPYDYLNRTENTRTDEIFEQIEQISIDMLIDNGYLINIDQIGIKHKQQEENKSLEKEKTAATLNNYAAMMYLSISEQTVEKIRKQTTLHIKKLFEQAQSLAPQSAVININLQLLKWQQAEIYDQDLMNFVQTSMDQQDSVSAQLFFLLVKRDILGFEIHQDELKGIVGQTFQKTTQNAQGQVVKSSYLQNILMMDKQILEQRLYFLKKNLGNISNSGNSIEPIELTSSLTFKSSQKFDTNKTVELGDVQELQPSTIFFSNNEAFIGIICSKSFLVIDVRYSGQIVFRDNLPSWNTKETYAQEKESSSEANKSQKSKSESSDELTSSLQTDVEDSVSSDSSNIQNAKKQNQFILIQPDLEGGQRSQSFIKQLSNNYVKSPQYSVTTSNSQVTPSEPFKNQPQQDQKNQNQPSNSFQIRKSLEQPNSILVDKQNDGEKSKSLNEQSLKQYFQTLKTNKDHDEQISGYGHLNDSQQTDSKLQIQEKIDIQNYQKEQNNYQDNTQSYQNSDSNQQISSKSNDVLFQRKNQMNQNNININLRGNERRSNQLERNKTLIEFVENCEEKDKWANEIPSEWMGDIQHNGKKVALYDKAQIKRNQKYEHKQNIQEVMYIYGISHRYQGSLETSINVLNMRELLQEQEVLNFSFSNSNTGFSTIFVQAKDLIVRQIDHYKHQVLKKTGMNGFFMKSIFYNQHLDNATGQGIKFYPNIQQFQFLKEFIQYQEKNLKNQVLLPKINDKILAIRVQNTKEIQIYSINQKRIIRKFFLQKEIQFSNSKLQESIDQDTELSLQSRSETIIKQSQSKQEKIKKKVQIQINHKKKRVKSKLKQRIPLKEELVPNSQPPLSSDRRKKNRIQNFLEAYEASSRFTDPDHYKYFVNHKKQNTSRSSSQEKNDENKFYEFLQNQDEPLILLDISPQGKKICAIIGNELFIRVLNFQQNNHSAKNYNGDKNMSAFMPIYQEWFQPDFLKKDQNIRIVQLQPDHVSKSLENFDPKANDPAHQYDLIITGKATSQHIQKLFQSTIEQICIMYQKIYKIQQGQRIKVSKLEDIKHFVQIIQEKPFLLFESQIKPLKKQKYISLCYQMIQQFPDIDKEQVKVVAIDGICRFFNLENFLFARSYDTISAYLMSSTWDKNLCVLLTGRKVQVYNYLKGSLYFEIKVANAAAFAERVNSNLPNLFLIDQDNLLVIRDGQKRIVFVSITTQIEANSQKITKQVNQEITFKIEQPISEENIKKGNDFSLLPKLAPLLRQSSPVNGKNQLSAVLDQDNGSEKDSGQSEQTTEQVNSKRFLEFQHNIDRIFTTKSTSPYSYLIVLSKQQLFLYYVQDDSNQTADYNLVMYQDFSLDLNIKSMGEIVALDFDSDCTNFVAITKIGWIQFWNIEKKSIIHKYFINLPQVQECSFLSFCDLKSTVFAYFPKSNQLLNLFFEFKQILKVEVVQTSNTIKGQTPSQDQSQSQKNSNMMRNRLSVKKTELAKVIEKKEIITQVTQLILEKQTDIFQLLPKNEVSQYGKIISFEQNKPQDLFFIIFQDQTLVILSSYDTNSFQQTKEAPHKEQSGLGKSKEPIMSIHKIIRIGCPFESLQINKSCRMLSALSKDCKKIKLFLFKNVFEIKPLMPSTNLGVEYQKSKTPRGKSWLSNTKELQDPKRNGRTPSPDKIGDDGKEQKSLIQTTKTCNIF